MRTFLALFLIWIGVNATAQDISLLFQKADQFEKIQNEEAALDLYKQIVLKEPKQINALIKIAELTAIVGTKKDRAADKKIWFETALAYANRAYATDSNYADANYVMAMASGKMTEVESDNKKTVWYVREIKKYADKAISINSKHAKANYSIGKWHYEMVQLSTIKKIAVKLLYGGLPDANLEMAITYMEKCKTLSPYFTNNYLDLAKAYRENRQPQKAIDVLLKLVKLPTRTTEDISIKAEGAKILQSLQ